MRRCAPALLLLASCLSLDPFLFGNEPVDEYGWDDDPCDPLLTGEVTEECHPSRVPPEERTEGFVDGIHYVFAHRPGATTTIFYSHGTGRHLGRYWDRVELMWELGFNVMIYDYPGYGRSEGEPDEASVYASAEAVLGVLPSMPDVDPAQVVFLGYSLGGGPTYEMALNGPITPRAVVSEATFCSIEALVQDGAKLSIPGGFLSTVAFDNCAKAAQLPETIPVTIIHGADDDFVLPDHGRALARAVGEGVTLHMVPGAGHSTIPAVARADYERWLLEAFE